MSVAGETALEDVGVIVVELLGLENNPAVICLVTIINCIFVSAKIATIATITLAVA